MPRKLRNEELGRLDVLGYKNAIKTPITIILDDVRSLNNLGSIFRSADVYRIEKIYLCGITAVPPHRDIRKTALGATESVPWEYHQNVRALIKQLSPTHQIVAIEQAVDAVPLSDFYPAKTKPLALVFGNEVNGVQQEVVDLSDVVVVLRQYGTKHSLNISVCAGIVLYDLSQKMGITDLD